MILQPIFLYLLLSPAPTIGASAALEYSVPVYIQEIEAHFVGDEFAHGSGNTMVKFCQFHLTCTIIPQDSSFESCLPLTIVGTLPAGRQFSLLVYQKDLKLISENLFSFEFDLNVQKAGWASFTLTTKDAIEQDNLYIYEFHSNIVEVNLNCVK